MKRFILLGFILMLVIGWFGILVGVNYLEQHDYEGAAIKKRDVYQLYFMQMNKSDDHTMAVETGRELAIDYEIDQGNVDLVIRQGEDVLYRGKRIDSAGFRLPIENVGDCTVEVKGTNARGTVSVAVI